MDPTVVMPTLRGRAAEVEALHAWLGSVSDDGVQVLLVEGEAGIGKTCLLEAARALSVRAGLAVFVGSGDELERSRPFGAMVHALSSRAPGAAALPGVVQQLDRDGRGSAAAFPLTHDPALQFRLVDTVVEALEEVALGGPLALLIDDLQWADHSTLLTLNALTRRLGYLDVAVLVTMRHLPRTPDLAQLLARLTRDGARRLVLGALDDRAVAELARDIVGAEPGESLQAAIASAAGNPLFVTELLRVLGHQGVLKVVDGRAELERTAVPPSLRAAILRRLGFLGGDALELLHHASMLGTTFSLRDVATVTGRSASDLTRRLRPAIQAGLLQEDGSRLRFRHDLVRTVLYEDQFVAVRAALHQEAAKRLAAAGASSLQVARHIVLGASPADEEAIAWLHEAAREAGRQAPATAAELLEHALEMSSDACGRRSAMLADLVAVLLWCGRPRDAEQRAREGLRLNRWDPAQDLLRLGLVQALSIQGRYQDLIHEVGLSVPVRDATANVAAQLLAESANAHLFLGDSRAAENLAREAVSLGRQVRSAGEAAGLMILADVARGRGDLHASLAYARRAFERTDRRGGVVRGWRPEIFLAMALRGLDRFEEADEAIQRGRIADEEQGHVTFLPVYSYELATGRYLAGRWDEAVTEAEGGLALADEVGLVMLRSWPRSVLALIGVHRGDLRAAGAHLAECEHIGPSALSSIGLHSPRLALARGLFREASDDTGGALDTLQQAWEVHAERGNIAAMSLLAPDLVRLTVHGRDRITAERVAAAVEHTARLNPLASLEATALHCRGLVDADAETLVRAASRFGRTPRRFEHARACEAAAAELARADRRHEAKQLFDAAIDAFDDIGARRAAASALASARALGIGRKRRGATKRPAHGWEALTPSEIEVVHLAATGLTNPEVGRRLFISRRTVQTHLSSAFRKLEITSRVELATLVARRARASPIVDRADGSRGG